VDLSVVSESVVSGDPGLSSRTQEVDDPLDVPVVISEPK